MRREMENEQIVLVYRCLPLDSNKSKTSENPLNLVSFVFCMKERHDMKAERGGHCENTGFFQFVSQLGLSWMLTWVIWASVVAKSEFCLIYTARHFCTPLDEIFAGITNRRKILNFQQNKENKGQKHFNSYRCNKASKTTLTILLQQSFRTIFRCFVWDYFSPAEQLTWSQSP